MSYSKFHYFESACAEFDSVFARERFSVSEFALCYLALVSIKSGIDLKKEISTLINELNKKESITHFLMNSLGRYASKDLTCFTGVPLEELEEYLVSYQAEKIAFFGEKSTGLNSTPWEIAKLASMILEPKKDDTVADFCFGSGSFSFTLLDNYDVKKIDGYEINFEQEQIGEVISDVRGYDVSIHNVDLMRNPPVGSKYSKIFCHCPFAIKLDKREEKWLYESLPLPTIKKLRSEYIFIQRVLDCLTEDGKAIVFVPLPILSAKDGFMEYLTRNGYINAVIQFAPNLLQGTAIPFAMLVLSFNNENIKLIDASDMYTKSRWKNFLSTNDIGDISLSYFEETEENVKLVNCDDIITKEFDLNLCNYFYESKIELPGVDCEYKLLSDLCVRPITRGVQYKAEDLDDKITLAPTNIFYLAANGIQQNRIIDELPAITEIEEKNNSYCLEEGDLVLSNVNSTSLKLAVVRKLDDKKIIAGSTLYIIRPNQNLIMPSYLKMLLETDIAIKLSNIYNSGSASISAEFLNNLQIPVIPMSEQEKVSCKYDSYEEKIEMLKAGILSIETEKKSIFDSLSKEGN